MDRWTKEEKEGAEKMDGIGSGLIESRDKSEGGDEVLSFFLSFFLLVCIYRQREEQEQEQEGYLKNTQHTCWWHSRCYRRTGSCRVVSCCSVALR